MQVGVRLPSYAICARCEAKLGSTKPSIDQPDSSVTGGGNGAAGLVRGDRQAPTIAASTATARATWRVRVGRLGVAGRTRVVDIGKEVSQDAKNRARKIRLGP